MPRVVVTVSGTYGGYTFRKGEVIEASAAVQAALGASARAVTGSPGATASPGHDQLGESAAASNSSA